VRACGQLSHDTAVRSVTILSSRYAADMSRRAHQAEFGKSLKRLKERQRRLN